MAKTPKLKPSDVLDGIDRQYEDRKKRFVNCWGCGDDFLSRWKRADLVQVEIKDFGRDTVCPDCHQELLDTGEVQYT